MSPRRSEVQVSLISRLRGLVALLRPINAFMMAFAVLVGVALAEGGLPTIGLEKLAAGMVAGFFILGSAMVFNDYADIDIDRINTPDRPIPRGLISPRTALIYAVILGLAGLVAAAYTGLVTLILGLAAWATSILYDFWGKATGLPGNFMVSFNVAMPIAYGAALASRFNVSILVFWLMIFLSNTGREVVKGIADMQGDASRGIRTLAITMGARRASVVAVGFTMAAVALSPLPLILSQASLCYLTVVLADAGFIHSSILILKDQSPANARLVKNKMLAYMLIGLVAFLLAGAPCV